MPFEMFYRKLKGIVTYFERIRRIRRYGLIGGSVALLKEVWPYQRRQVFGGGL